MTKRVLGVRWVHDDPPEIQFEFDSTEWVEHWIFGQPYPELHQLSCRKTEWVRVTPEEFERLWNDRLANPATTDQ